MLILSVKQPKQISAKLLENLHFIHNTVQSIQHKRAAPAAAGQQHEEDSGSETGMVTSTSIVMVFLSY